MKAVEITYFPYRWLGLKKTIKGSFPQNWGDCNASHLLAIVAAYKGAITELRLLEVMSGIKHKVLKKLDEYQVLKLSELFEFIKDQKPWHEFIIRKIETSGNVYIRPQAKLKGVSFGQFIFADTYLAIYQEKGDESDLNKLVASLYLKQSEKFSEELIDERLSEFEQVSGITKESVAMNWQLIREWLHNAYPLIFQKLEDTEEEERNTENKDEPAQIDHSRWIKVFDNLVGDNLLESDKWANTPVNNVFRFMTRKYKETAKK